MTWTLTLPIQPPSANAHVVNSNHRASAAKYRRLRNSLVAALDWMAHVSVTGITPATGKRLVTVTRLIGKGQRELDYDNWVTACKPLIDAMKPPRDTGKSGRRRITPGLGWLVDDSPAYVTVTYNQQRSPDGKVGTRIEIEEE